MASFKLSRTLQAHEGDVRGIVFPKNDLLASVSRDCTLRTWNPMPGSSSSSYGIEWTSKLTYHSSKYLNSIAWIGDKGLIATGGLDSTIVVLHPDNSQVPTATLKGHEGNVCALHYNEGVLISGSWDKTARVWIDGSCKYILKAHEQAVWAVLVVAPDTYLTGSADKTIRLWNTGTQTAVFQGHSDVVRDLCMIDSNKFASCSNDGSIRVWNFSGSCLYELYGHTSFIYSIASFNGEIYSTSEDRTLRVWRDGNCIETISHPCTSLWCVSVCPTTGDIATGGSDSMVRVFSRIKDNWATAEEMAAFDEQVAGYAISTSEVGNINKEKIPGPEALTVPGKNVGQVIMIKTPTSSVDAHQWDGEKWVKIGEVVSAVGNQQKQIYEGKEYDYVFDVDIQDGVPPLKLPYNATENSFDAARRFLERNELPLSYLDETAKFIEQNTGGVHLGEQSTPAFEDPYGSRYVPQGESASSESAVPVKSTPKKSGLLPQASYLFIKKANIAALTKKIQDVSSNSADKALSEGELKLIISSSQSLESGISGNVADALLGLAINIVQSWAPRDKLVGLDLMRLCVGSASNIELVEVAVGTLLGTADVISRQYPNNVMMAFRVLANLFESVAGRSVIHQNELKEKIIDTIREYAIGDVTTNVAVAVSTVILNFTVFINKENDVESAFSIIGILTEFLTVIKDSECAYRLLVAFGTLLSLQSVEVKEAGDSLDGKKIVSMTSTKFSGEQRIVVIADEVLSLLN
ncbi:WD40-repeat-containing domain protein [Dipodascopsis uninucleata]